MSERIPYPCYPEWGERNLTSAQNHIATASVPSFLQPTDTLTSLSAICTVCRYRQHKNGVSESMSES
jgi:hypothetical protein